MLAEVSAAAPDPKQAQLALEEATRRAKTIRGADRAYRPVLLILAACDLTAGLLVGLQPRGGSLFAGVALVVALAATVAVVLTVLTRIRVHSRGGVVRFGVAVAAWSWWNAAVIAASVASGWWGPQQPGFHFTASMVVSSIPLFTGAWLIGRR